MQTTPQSIGKKPPRIAVKKANNSLAWRFDWQRQKFIRFDRQIENWLGFPASSWRDLDDWVDRMHPEDRLAVTPRLITRANRGQRDSGDFRALTSDGKVTWLHYDAEPVQRDGATILIKGRLSRTNAPNPTSSAEIKSILPETAQDFARTIGHDLKSPLSAINGYADLLRLSAAEKLDQREQSYLAAVTEGSARLIHFVEDLVTLARSDADKRVPVPVDLNAALGSALQHLALEIARAGARVRAGTLPTVKAEMAPMVRLLQNIVQNAVKYRAPDRPPVIEITARPGSGAIWQISIADNGRGIAPRDLDRVFEIFTRPGPVAGIDGNGVGLASCRKIAADYGGKLWVESRLGEGSVFHLELPAAE